MILKTVYCLQLADKSGYIRMIKPSNVAYVTNDPEMICLWVDEIDARIYAMAQPLYRGLIIKRVHIQVED